MSIEVSVEGDQVGDCVIKLARVVVKVRVRPAGSHICAPGRFDVWQDSKTTKWVHWNCLWRVLCIKGKLGLIS